MYKWTKEQSDDGDDDNYGFKKNTRDTGQSFCRLERGEFIKICRSSNTHPLITYKQPHTHWAQEIYSNLGLGRQNNGDEERESNNKII